MRSNKLIFVLSMGFVLSLQSSEAQSLIAGTSKIDPSRMIFPPAPGFFLLKKSTYQCESCLPPLAVRANAADHPVKRSPCIDTLRVSIPSDDTVE